MKFTVEGFSQEEAIKMNLTPEDLVILRWFVDFWPSPKMVKMVHDGKEYALVNYSGFIKQMPIVGCNKRTIARKFQRLVEANVLENVTIKQGGTFSVYRFGPNYDTLVQKCATVVEDCTTGLSKNVQPGLDKNVQPNTNPINTTNLSTTNHINTDKESVRHQYGEYKNVLLTDEDMEKLKSEFPDDWEKRIEDLSTGIAVHGYKYKNHLAAIRAWATKNKKKEKPKEPELEKGQIIQCGNYTYFT